ncbi:MAG: hypothetical protein Q9188_003717 [Gyalolechia gomerana]
MFFTRLYGYHTLEDFISRLRDKISKGSRVLTPGEPEFTRANERWTEIDRKTPAVIVQPAAEEDVAIIVSPKLGFIEKILIQDGSGCSPWSTIENGLIIHLSLFKEVSVDQDRHTVAVRGGVLVKELQITLSKQGHFTTVANGNTAIRGAGQFFGNVTELVLRTHKPSLMGPDGVRQLGMIFYPTERASEVCRVLKNVVSANDHASAGHFMVMNDPSKGRMLMVAGQYFGTGPELQATFQPLIDLGPLDHAHQPSTFESHSDHLSWMCYKGDFKRFSQTGLRSINPDNFERLVHLH